MIHLKNIRLPRLPPVDPNIDLAYLNEEGEHWFRKRQFGIETLTRNLSHDDLETPDRENGSHERYQPNLQGSLRILLVQIVIYTKNPALFQVCYPCLATQLY